MSDTMNFFEKAAKKPPKNYTPVDCPAEQTERVNLSTQAESIQSAESLVSSPPTNTEKKNETRSALEIVLYSMLEHHAFIVHQNQLYVYRESEGYWQLLPNTSAQTELRNLTPDSVKRYAMKISFPTLYEWLINEAEHVKSDFFTDDRRYVNFLDCCYNLESGKKHTDRKHHHFTYALQVNFPCNESTGAYESFVNSIFDGDKNTINSFCAFLTLAVINSREFKYCFFFLGPSHSGKSTILNSLRYLFGPHYSSVSFSQFASEFALCELLTSRINLSAEISATTNKRIDILKTLTGMDSYTLSRKGQQHFRVDSNKAMLVFASNILPSFLDRMKTASFLSRAVFFPFGNPIPRHKWNPNLLTELNKDIAGFWNLVLKGWKHLNKHDFQIEESESMKFCKNEVSGLWESFSTFCKKYIKKDLGGKLTSAEIQEAYEIYCNIHDYTCLKPSQWSRILKITMLCQSSTKTIDAEEGSTRVRAYKGIAFKEEISKLLEKDHVFDNNAATPEQLPKNMFFEN